MPGAFFGLDIANTALSAAQVLMDVAGQNIANDATPGYSRQVAEPTTTTPYAQPDMGGTYTPQLGTGVEISSVNRVRASYLDGLFRTTQSAVGLYSTRQGYLSALQSVLNEPGQNGLSSALNRFFGDFQTLSQDPQSSAARTVVQQDGEAVTAQIQQIYQGLQSVGQQAQSQATQDVQTVNSDLQQLANLNTTIASAQALGQQPNDLLDQRDNVLDSLSKLININVSRTVTLPGGAPAPQGQYTTNAITQVSVSIQDTSGNQVTLLSGGDAGSLTLTPSTTAGAPQFTLSATAAANTTYTGSGSIAPTGGTIGAAYGFVNQDLNPSQAGPPPSLMYQFNQAVSQLASAVNAQHAAGYYQDPTNGAWATGLNFFAPSSGTTITAANIEVNPLIQGNTAYIAAGATASPGDGQNATAIANIAQEPSGPLSQYGGFVANVGSQVDLSQNLQNTAQSLLSQVTSQRQQTAGVSINEEMTNLVQAQAMYTAASKVAQIMDSSLQSLISAIQP
ncbi:MAG: flagellar hook-associated protein FlgK [Thermaerobacter sp.]|nr:flagellar hook-associated protein FlgK [Thermaerobacter sp.]